MKQKAVEWLIDKLTETQFLWLSDKPEMNQLIEIINQAKEMEKQQQDNFAIEFVEWKDNHFLIYKDSTYYAKTSSIYFDSTKYISKEKPTKYYLLKELLEIFKKEKGL